MHATTTNTSTVSQRFPKARRVRRRAEFQQVFDGGMRIHGRYLTLILRRTSTSCTRLGIVASKKIGGAVERNRAKRRVRDLFRRQSDGGPALDVVVIPRPDLIHAPFPMLAQDFRSVWRRGVERLASRDRG